MRKNMILTGVAATLFLYFGKVEAVAQSEAPKIELGIQFSVIQFRGIETLGPIRGIDSRVNLTASGVGGRVTYNINDWLSVEGEANSFPEKRLSLPDPPDIPFLLNPSLLNGGKKTQMLAGVKAGLRTESAGIFGKARPGFVRSSKAFKGGLECLPQPPFIPGDLTPPASCFGGRTDFALDLGAVIELYPSRGIGVRFDVGNTIIVGRDRTVEVPLLGSAVIRGNNTFNPQLSAGFSLRF